MDFGEAGLNIFQMLSPVILAVLTWVSTKVAKLIQAKVDNEYLRGVLVRLDDAVFTTVKEIQQTIVNEIKIANEDGRITKEERENIKRIALDHLKKLIGWKGLKLLGKVFGLSEGGLDEFLESRLESAVLDLRSDESIVLAPTDRVLIESEKNKELATVPLASPLVSTRD